jgi:hypothetical protein
MKKRMTEHEEALAKTIMLSMIEHFKEGTEKVNSDFALRAMALALAGLISNCGRKRKEFLNFMAAAWDEMAVANRKIDGAS